MSEVTELDVADIQRVAAFLVGWWPGLEDGLSWPADADDPDSNEVYAAAKRLTERFPNHLTPHPHAPGEMKQSKRLLLTDEEIGTIAYEAFMVGRVYTRMGEQEPPAEIHAKLMLSVGAALARYRAAERKRRREERKAS